MRRAVGVVRPLWHQRQLTTSAWRLADANGSGGTSRRARRPLTDEYGARPKPLPPLARDGTTVDGPTSRLRKETRRTPELVDEDEAEMYDTGSRMDEKDEPAATTTFEASVRHNLKKYPDAILLTQVGSFYESYFDQAPLLARLLGIKLTSKMFGKGSKKARYPFAGFPLAQLIKHVSTLVEAGHKVVVVEEFKAAGGSTSRRVTRIVTPGTGIEEGLATVNENGLEQPQPRFVLALGVLGEDEAIGMAYRDVATGAAFTRTSTLARLRDDILLVEPKEIVMDKTARDSPLTRKVWDVLRAESTREGIMLSESSTDAVPTSVSSSASTGGGLSPAESAAEDVLLAYLAATLLTSPPPRIKPTHIDPSRVMQMDSTTLKSLEVKESLRGGLRGSLLSAIKRTSTPGGARLLQERLCAPSTVLDEINARLALVAAFHDLTALRRYLAPLLRSLDDSSRVLQRLYLRRGSAFDLLSLKKTINVVDSVRLLLEDAFECQDLHEDDQRVAIKALRQRLGRHGDLAEEIERAIDEEALVERTEIERRKTELALSLGETHADRLEEDEATVAATGSSANGGGGISGATFTEGLWGRNEPWAVRPNFSPGLRKLHGQLTDLRRAADQLEKDLRAKYKTKALSLKVQAKFGAVVHIMGKTTGYAAVEEDPKAHMVIKTGSTRSYMYGDWASLNAKINGLTSRIAKLEDETMKVLFARVSDNYDALQTTMSAMDELDVALGFAEAAVEMNLVRPVVDERSSLTIEAGRHPTVERALQVQGRAFTPNSVHFDHPSSFVHVLTGPNMAGKSTFLRQTALITILAQAGSFVPADSVRMGVVDRVFSRVGARDELDRDRSTFMIEMDEATSILQTATDKSLVLMDELGRGTSPLDGLAIAYAALEHIVHVNRSRTLFATHYHRLGELLGYDDENMRGRGEWEGVEFWCTDVDEREDSVAYIHEVRRGLNDDSAGLIIARLSGMPQRAIRVATELRNRYR